MTTSHCLLSQESNRNRHHTCIFYWSFNFVVKGRGEEISISSITLPFPNYSKVCLPSGQTEAGGCTYVWEEGFSGHSNVLSHQTAQNSSGSSLQLFSSLVFVRVITGGSKSFLLICLQTQRLLHREREYSQSHNRQHEKQ